MKSLKNILITGGSGMVGRRLTDLLLKRGYTVAWLSRNSNTNTAYPGIKIFEWNPTNHFIAPEALKFADVIVHLAGAGIADSLWTKKRKQVIRDSRIQSGEVILQNITNYPNIKKLISASAIGIYGDNKEKWVTEEDVSTNNDFLTNTCKAWESVANKAKEKNLTTVVIRTGIVLNKNEGILQSMQLALSLRLAVIFGSGNQFLSWIHIDDLCEIYFSSISNDSLSGIYNAIAPNPVRNKVFIKDLFKTNSSWNIPIKIPSFILKLFMGNMSKLLLDSCRASSKKIESTGYTFQYPNLQSALKNIYSK